MARERYLIHADEMDFQEREKIKLTGWKKVKNFFYYNTVKILMFLFFGGLIGIYIYQVVTVPKPDYTIAFVTRSGMSEQVATQIAEEFKKSGEDVNGDGKIIININSYTYLLGNDAMGQSAQTAQTELTRVISDFETCTSMIFITDETCFNNMLPNTGTSFFVNLKTGATAPDELTDYSGIKVPYENWKAFDSFLLQYDVEGANLETLTDSYMNGLSVSVRTVNGTQHENDADKQEAFENALNLVQRVLGYE